jgi:chromosomal replication initiation ATPase DnaA
MTPFDQNMRDLMNLIESKKRDRARVYIMKLLKAPQIYDEHNRSKEQKFAKMLVQEISNHSGIDAVDLLSKSRRREISDMRQFTFWSIRATTKLSLGAIGGMFGRDHATVIHGMRNFENLVTTDQVYKESVKQLVASVNNTILTNQFYALINEEAIVTTTEEE